MKFRDLNGVVDALKAMAGTRYRGCVKMLIILLISKLI